MSDEHATKQMLFAAANTRGAHTPPFGHGSLALQPAYVHIAPGYEVSWGGEFESARRAGKRLAIVIPATIVLIFVLLFAMFGRPREAVLILGNVLLTSPVGGLAALLFTGTNFSVSSGVGFLALFGVSVQTGVILIAYINELRVEGLELDAEEGRDCLMVMGRWPAGVA